MSRFIINGKFLAFPITGVQRFAREIIAELDLIVNEDCVELVVPANAQNIPNLKKIKIVKSKMKASVFWEQVWLPIYTARKNAIGIHLCHVAPIFKPDVVCIHDVNVISNPKWFTKKIYLWYKLIEKISSKFSKKILTVSEFSQKELVRVLRIPSSKITVVSEGWQHLNNIVADEASLERHSLKKGQFYFSLGTRAPHKNIRWIYDYAKKHPKTTFVVSGFSDKRIYGQIEESIPENIKFLGYLSDEEIKSLMQNCKAFVFPSFYEGFGIPPLEALSTGSPVIVSDIPVMHEIFENAVHYIDPNNADVDLDNLLSEPVTRFVKVLDKYSWEKGAQTIWLQMENALKNV